MDRDDDVERLFSWIKTPDLHYREFAGAREVANTAATWPALRDAVPEPDPTDEHLRPEGSYESEMLPAEIARHADRPAALFGHREPPPPAHRPAEPPAYHPAPSSPPPEEEAGRDVPWAAEAPPPAPIFTRREPPPPPPPVVQREPPPPPPVVAEHQPAPPPPPPPPPLVQPQPVQTRPMDEQYRGFEEGQPTPPPPAAEPEEASKTRSLDAIFSRVAHPGSAPRDGRRQASSGPGLGPVFRRLR